jgi:hypothetical protein
MKKVLLSVVAILGLTFANAQSSDGKSTSTSSGFKAGVNFGMPMGDVKDGSSFALGLEVAYMYPVSDKFQVGASLGYSTFMAKEVGGVKGDNISFLPISAVLQYSFSDNIFAGLDLGYAVGMAPEGNDGGMTYQPKVGYQTEKFEVYAGYRGIAVEDFNVASINLGFNYKF